MDLFVLSIDNSCFLLVPDAKKSVMHYIKTLNSCVCRKLDLVTSLWLLECIFRAGLEQEIENLKKKLAACVRENSDLQEELSEAYRIKSQLADLHAAEVSKVQTCYTFQW
ncbi:uncharacterized protein LOC130755156 isoform X3 [Actinidia eriantha]|uniref:uncharacterized protein LOC130755156 isoform X3 n=1 Tax=Actinidia eriantha TaxID=165200 RepID=UPI002583701A|nr:uncharacterized protein LOC130755156 isoform X3 [Actinidia eriantha]